MCGRAKLEGDISQLKIAFRAPPDYPTPNFAPSWNVAPTDSLPIVRYHSKPGIAPSDLMRWGLVRYWAKDIKIGFSTINAMAEIVDTKPVFREAFKQRRCLVPVEAFYEWKKLGPKEKQPYAIALVDRGLMALAGLWETWRSPAQETVRSWAMSRAGGAARCHFGYLRRWCCGPAEAARHAAIKATYLTNSALLSGLLPPFGPLGCTRYADNLGLGAWRNSSGPGSRPVPDLPTKAFHAHRPVSSSASLQLRWRRLGFLLCIGL